ncbi:hypothetical protein Psal006b_03560 (plasmid) [Piscirickettsia salmonis]|uniref:Uncharacterized protein n=1 Tax=Piscirickettsia salmonis TaxID=1238 RepID=A0A1L6TIC7_PISSA|nr:hypothetical protein [Piscirickettsia salmonis]ALB24386.1 hypothetical protein KU39_1p45 [Piscirickettsia salmonis]ALT18984.1 hypothetical protein PSLF89_09120 [Piscirickettsia salmonis LF-89 = ATCC VR-1361]ALY04356.1 hypothetical protein AWE47_17485 [Piscirickettsia salmonis]AMA44103.1 hypothetical protein AWJ11_17150 [Piscirickettsia salmonis]AOS36850.1 hypothetical protein AVM72_15850 [Piscirickettsia salmonis]
MDEPKTLTKEEIEIAKAGKFRVSLLTSIFIIVLSFSFINSKGWALFVGVILSVLIIRRIFSLDNTYFKDKPTFNHADKYDACDPFDARNYSNQNSPYYRGNKNHH